MKSLSLKHPMRCAINKYHYNEARINFLNRFYIFSKITFLYNHWYRSRLLINVPLIASFIIITNKIDFRKNIETIEYCFMKLLSFPFNVNDLSYYLNQWNKYKRIRSTYVNIFLEMNYFLSMWIKKTIFEAAIWVLIFR